MDSWTVQQLQIMKAGGNNVCNSFLLEKGGIASSTPIRQKYDNPTANYYKEVLRARLEGKPEPPMSQVSNNNTSRPSSSSSNELMGKKQEEDPNGRERLSGETDGQYIARQTRLRDEARARLAAKGFGASSSMSSNASSGSSRGYMQGIGSDSSYDPSRGGYGNYPGVDITQVTGSIASGLGSAWSSIGTVATSVLKDDKNIVGSLSGSVLSTGAGLWSSFSSAAQGIAKNLTSPDMGGDDDDTDALMELQEMARAAKTNKYAGFGSENFQNANGNMTFSSSSSLSSSNALDNGDGSKNPNQLEPLEGESNEQYMEKQSRILNDARVRMEARFEAPPIHHGMDSKTATLTKDKESSGSFHSTVSSTSSKATSKASASRMKLDTSDDFFSSFGA